MAPTTAWPPPPSRSQISAILCGRGRGAHGFEPTEIFVETNLRQGNIVGCFRVEIVRNELVVAVDVGVRQVEADNAAVVFRTLLDRFDGVPVLFENRRQL